MSFSRRELLKLCSLALAYAPIPLNAETRKLKKGLKDYFANDFLVGAAVSAMNLLSSDEKLREIIKTEFNTLTMENEMKWERLHPIADTWVWEHADRFVNLGLAHQMHLVGHVLVWHSQTPDWVFRKENSQQARSAKEMLRVMENHISQVVNRYQGKIKTWDVVNEGFVEKGWRDSLWYRILGPQYMDRAFQITHGIDPSAELLYNDFSMHDPQKRAHVLNFLSHAQKNGVPVHGIGLQGHVGLDYPDINEFENSLIAYAKAGMRIHITEFDIDVLPNAYKYRGADISQKAKYKKTLNPWPMGLPQKVNDLLSKRYEQFFKLFLKHKDKIERVTFWGVSDNDSWKNDFPVEGRTNYPLLFDRDLNRKDAYQTIINLKDIAQT